MKTDEIELVLVDGASKDSTLSIINDNKDIVDKFISEPDKGIYDGMNKAIFFANGEYLLFMNAGDVFADNNVLSHVAKILKDNHPICVYGDVIRDYLVGSRLIKASRLSRLYYDMAFSHQSVFVQVSYMKENPFQTRYHYAADYAMMLNLYLCKVSFMYTNFPISIVEADGGATYRHFLSSRREALDIQLSAGCNAIFCRSYFVYVVVKLYVLKWVKSLYYKIKS